MSVVSCGDVSTYPIIPRTPSLAFFTNPIIFFRNLDSPRNEYSFQHIPGTSETLIVRIIKCWEGLIKFWNFIFGFSVTFYAILEPINCDLQFGPELLDFVFYRPDDLYSELRKNLEPTYPELDKLQKIKARVKQDFTQCVFITRGPRYLKTTSVSINSFLVRLGSGQVGLRPSLTDSFSTL